MEKVSEKLTQIIDDAIVAHLKEGETTVEEIFQTVVKRCDPETRKEIADLGDDLSDLIESRIEPAAAADPELRLELPQWVADHLRLAQARAFYALLEPIFREHPGITTGEALKLLEPPEAKTGPKTGRLQ